MKTEKTVLRQGQNSAQPAPVKSPSTLARLARKPVGLLAVIYVVGIILIAVAAPMIWPGVLTERTGDLGSVKLQPSPEHLFGTDSLGRDILLRILVGARVTLIGIAIALVVATVLGTIAGLVSGYFGGPVDRVLSWIADLLFSLPGIVLILLVLAVFPLSTPAAMITLGVLASPGMMRIVRSTVLPVTAELYVAAAKTYGISDLRIILRHVFPRILGPILVQIPLMAAIALVAQTGLAFLGLIDEPPKPSWGGLVAEGVQNIVSDPWMIWAPGLVIVITCLAFGAIGDTARDLYGESRSRGSVLTSTRHQRRTRNSAVKNVATVNHLREEEQGADEVVLRVEGLSISQVSDGGDKVPIVDEVSFELRRGEALALVGESGCGKSVTSMALLRAIPPELEIVSGRVLLEGQDLLGMNEPEIAKLRGRKIAVIAQEPMASLNPVFKVGVQVAEAVRQHRKIGRAAARRESIELMKSVGLKDAGMVWHQYPHELSGGMAQRVAIARALAGDPEVLVADEPTTALDVTVQGEILALLMRLQQERHMALLLVSHDWGVVAQSCDRIAVMYAGQIIETGSTQQILEEPAHPYTEALIAANPYHAKPKERLKTIPGTVPQPGHWPQGCHFIDRCAFANKDLCGGAPIPLTEIGQERQVRCVLAENDKGEGES